jgi:membrane protein DedA with SNARE-associated domain
VPYLVVFAIVFGINLLPAFGPPTWAVLVFTRLHWHLNPVALVLIGAIAASSGRYLLALAARRFSDVLPERMRTNLEDAQDLLKRHRNGTVAVFGVFVVSPLPSAQLFLAAGFLDLNLALFTLAFLVGRLVSYSIYMSLAVIAERQLGSVLGQLFGSPLAIVLQLLLLAAVCCLPLINWRRAVTRWSDWRSSRGHKETS